MSGAMYLNTLAVSAPTLYLQIRVDSLIFAVRGVRSVLSKVATFIRPEWFTAWDSFACAGLNIVIGRSMNAGFESYSDYLANFNDV
jgi:hypothetical protein